MRLLYFFIFCVFISSCVFGPLGTSKRAIKQLEKGDYVKSQKLVGKSIEKDSLLPAALYAKSRLLVSYDSPEFYDSAYYFVLRAQSIFDTMAAKPKEKHIKHGFDSLALQNLKIKIDSLAFDRALRKNTEEAFNEFLRKHPTARQVLLAKSKRNALAFAKAKAENTYQSYKEFMEKYPEAVQVAEAKERYEKLYFHKSTADGKVTSFIRFLEKHPETPYRKEAEQKIFEVMTSEHSLGGYTLFLKNYPKSHLRKKAINYAYHVAKETDTNISISFLNDSLRHVQQLEPYVLLTYLEEAKFGFMDANAYTVIKPSFNLVADLYKCEATHNDFLQVNNTLIGRNGATIYQGDFDQVVDLGYGILAFENNERWGVLHKSGEMILKPEFDKIRLIKGSVLVLKKEKLWRLQTVSGRKLVEDNFDDLYTLGNYIIFEKNELFEIKTLKQLMSAVDNALMKFEYLYDDYEILPNGDIWLASTYGETIMNKELNEVIPYGKKEIKILNNGYLVTEGDRSTFYSEDFQKSLRNLHQPLFNHSWLISKVDSTLKVYHLSDFKFSLKTDSARLLGNTFIKIFQGDSTFLYFKNKEKIWFDNEENLSVISHDSIEYLVSKSEETSIHNEIGSLIIKGAFENLSTLGSDYLVFNKRNKKGAIETKSGKVVVAPKYEAIGNYLEGNISLLTDKKFGLYHRQSDKIFPAEYEKNLSSYNDSTLIGQKKNKQFLLTPNNEPLNKEGFDDIIHWTDTSAFVKLGADWQIFSLVNQTLSGLKFQSFDLHTTPTGEKLAVIYSDTKYGLLSNIRGIVISPTFNDLILLPTDKDPLIFTEKHIKEAAFYVVIYYDLAGNVLKKQAYEAGDYDKIYCDN